MRKKNERIRTLESVVHALVGLLHRKGIVKRDEVQLQILEDAATEPCPVCHEPLRDETISDGDEVFWFKVCDKCGHKEDEWK